MAAPGSRRIPVGLNVWSRLVASTFPYLDQTAAPFDSLWFPDHVQYGSHAVAEGWTRNELRRRLRVERGHESPTTSATVRFSAEPTRTARWQHAAALDESGLEQWIVKALDEAASRVISGA